MMQPADFGQRDDLARADGGDRTRVGRVLAEREMRPRPVVVREVGAEETPQVPFVEHDDVIQALAAKRADDALDVRILPGRPRRRANGRQA